MLIMPILVVTVLPSMSGSRSRCTPSRETSLPLYSPLRQILSISSINTMPRCSTICTASAFSSSSFTRRAASSSVSTRKASSTRIFLRWVLPVLIFWNMPLSWLAMSSMPGGAKISMPGRAASSSTSTSLSFRLPSRSFWRNFSRVLL